MLTLSLTAQLRSGGRTKSRQISRVVGVGIVGQLVVQYLKASGARRIVVIDTIQRRLEMAELMDNADPGYGSKRRS
jgi:threonine dehydrogenase-like Zn-dependent dehydrogenase